MKKIAEMLRGYHDAVEAFPFIEEFEPLDNTPANYEVLCHNDFALYNIIFQGGKPAGIIDFDVARPGPRIWDIAYTLFNCVPLGRYHPFEKAEHAQKINARIKKFFTSYGVVPPCDLFEIVKRRLEGLCHTLIRKAEEGDPAFQKMVKEGHVDHYKKEIQFIRSYEKTWKRS